MPTAATDEIIDELNLCLSRLNNATPRYILESNPYITDKDKPVMATLKEAAATDHQLFLEGAKLIEDLDGIPKIGLPNPLLAELNYLSFPHLLDILIEETDKETEHLAKETLNLAAEPQAKAFVDKLLEARRAQSAKFKDIREKNYKEA